MICRLSTGSMIEDSSLIGKECWIGAVESNCHRANRPQNQLDVVLVIGCQNAPGLDSRHWVAGPSEVTLVLVSLIRILLPRRQTVPMNVVKRQERIASCASSVDGGVAIDKLLNRKVDL